MGERMGVIEVGNEWFESAYSDIGNLLEDALRGWVDLRYRYREGDRAVMLWPEERMGEVVEL